MNFERRHCRCLLTNAFYEKNEKKIFFGPEMQWTAFTQTASQLQRYSLVSSLIFSRTFKTLISYSKINLKGKDTFLMFILSLL